VRLVGDPDHQQNQVKRESLFRAHEEGLFNFALQLTEGRIDLADDLVEDVHRLFVRTRPGPPLDDASHVRAYLGRMLKDLFIGSERRAGEDVSSLLRSPDNAKPN
jgi:DNA-directed RNA polymerase specialized sigma24 family protein